MAEDRADPLTHDLERRWASVRGRMEAIGDVLGRRGSIASRLTGGGTRVYSVRYKEPGGLRQRAIYLGRDGDLADRARALLGECRERERRTREVEGAARFVAASGAWVRRLVGSPRGRS